jgi:hypothetical protein
MCYSQYWMTVAHAVMDTVLAHHRKNTAAHNTLLPANHCVATTHSRIIVLDLDC